MLEPSSAISALVASFRVDLMTAWLIALCNCYFNWTDHARLLEHAGSLSAISAWARTTKAELHDTSTVKDSVWKMVCDKVVCERWCVTKMLCERWCVTKMVCESCVWQRWCVKDGVCERWRVATKSQHDKTSATPATQNEGECDQVPHLPQAMQNESGCEQVPLLPRKTKVDVSKCHACHTKRRWMSRSATPATQNEGGCCQVPRLPRKVPRRHRRLIRSKRATRASPVP